MLSMLAFVDISKCSNKPICFAHKLRKIDVAVRYHFLAFLDPIQMSSASVSRKANSIEIK